MNSIMLEYFIAVARWGSISRAALDLGIEQSTITRQITKLETGIGTRLFHRSGRGMVLSDAGQTFLPHAKAVAQALEQASDCAAQLVASGPAQLVIAAQPTIALMLFGPLSYALKERFPHTKLKMIESLAHHVLHGLVEGKVDVALLYVPTHANVLDYDVILHEPLCCIAPPGRRIRGPLSIDKLLQMPLILPSTQHGLFALMASLAEQEGLPLNLAMESDASNAVTKQLVEEGHGYTVLPLASVQHEIAAKRLQAIAIDDPRLIRKIGIAVPKNRPSAAAVWEINQLIRNAVLQRVTSGHWPGAQVVQDLPYQLL